MGQVLHGSATTTHALRVAYTIEGFWSARCFIPVRLRVYITVNTGALESDGGGSADPSRVL